MLTETRLAQRPACGYDMPGARRAIAEGGMMRTKFGTWLGRAVVAVSIVAAGAAPAQAPDQGFLAQRPDIRAWLPPAPPPGSLAEAEDETIYLHTRTLLDGPRGAEATADNVYLPEAVAPRFADALGLRLNPRETPLTLALIGRVVKDAEALVAPVKQSPP